MTENDAGKSQKQTDLAVSDTQSGTQDGTQDGTQMLLKVLPKMLPKVLLKVRRKPDTRIRYVVLSIEENQIGDLPIWFCCICDMLRHIPFPQPLRFLVPSQLVSSPLTPPPPELTPPRPPAARSSVVIISFVTFISAHS